MVCRQAEPEHGRLPQHSSANRKVEKVERNAVLKNVSIGFRPKTEQNLQNPENRCNRYLAGMVDLAGCSPVMSSDAPPDSRDNEFSRPLSALLSDDSVRVFAIENCGVGAALCLIAAAVLSWTGFFSGL